jgi:mannosyltransferase
MDKSATVGTRGAGTAGRVLALTLLALVLRSIALGHKGLWQDEIFSVLFARPSNAEFWSVLRTAEANMAIYYLALRGWMHVFTGDAGVRVLSVIPGVLSVPVMFALGERLYSWRVGLWGAGLLTINACAVVYSQEARGYSMVVLFVALSCWALLKLVENNSTANFVLYTAFTVCAFYSHFYAVFVVLAQACAVAWLPPKNVPWKSLFASWLLFAVAMIPGLRVVFLSHGSNLWWLPKPGWLELYRTVTFLAAESGKAVGAVLAVLLLIPIALALRTGWRVIRDRGRSIESFRASFAPLGLLVPMVTTMALSLWRPMFFHRFLIVCLVPFLLLAAAGLDQVQTSRNRRWLVIGIVGLSTASVAISYTKVREDWRGAAALTQTAGANDPVVFYLKDAAAPFAFYRDRLGQPLRAEQILRLETPPSADQVAEWVKQYPRIWVVRFPSSSKDPVDIQMSETMGQKYRMCARRVFKGISLSWFVSGDCPAQL